MAIHGGPGTGKTSLALALGAYLAPFGIRALFITADENAEDLKNRMTWLVPEDIQRLSIFSKTDGFSLNIQHVGISPGTQNEITELSSLEAALKALAQTLKERNRFDEEVNTQEFRIPKPCSAIVVLDGLQDLFSGNAGEDFATDRSQIALLYPLIGALRELQALVIVTTGLDWAGNRSLDYLVDIAIHLSHESMAEDAVKPHRRLKVSKARHQLAAGGTHGLQIAGSKGVRFSPQINYQLDRRTVWKTRLPNVTEIKKVVRLVARWSAEERFSESKEFKRISPRKGEFYHSEYGPDIFGGSHIFINGQGSGGKAGLALKIAIAPSHSAEPRASDIGAAPHGNKVLIVSFLYPQDYYMNLASKLRSGHRHEYFGLKLPNARIKVIHLYPGHLRPNDLYNKIEWELDAAELDGEPYTCVVIDGIHNVYVQFPEIARYSLFWPQIYNSLRSRGVMTITTHTILRAPALINGDGEMQYRIDDGRSETASQRFSAKDRFSNRSGSIFPQIGERGARGSKR
jgi:KaiC/GvpD/RAD55 family RecA-like ATPase